MTKEQAYAALSTFITIYPRADLSVETIKAWARLIADLDYEQAVAGVSDWCLNERWAPQSVAEIRERVVTVSGATGPDPEAAWAEVIEKVHTVGWSGVPAWSHPTVGQAADALRGGWVQLCQTLLMDELPAERAHFLRIYTARRSEHRRGLQALPPSQPPMELEARP